MKEIIVEILAWIVAAPLAVICAPFVVVFFILSYTVIAIYMGYLGLKNKLKH